MLSLSKETSQIDDMFCCISRSTQRRHPIIAGNRSHTATWFELSPLLLIVLNFQCGSSGGFLLNGPNDSFNLRKEILFGEFEVVVTLKIHPEFRSHVEVYC